MGATATGYRRPLRISDHCRMPVDNYRLVLSTDGPIISAMVSWGGRSRPTVSYAGDVHCLRHRLGRSNDVIGLAEYPGVAGRQFSKAASARRRWCTNCLGAWIQTLQFAERPQSHTFPGDRAPPDLDSSGRSVGLRPIHSRPLRSTDASSFVKATSTR